MAVADRHVSVPVSLCSEDIVEWLKSFEICSKANKWTVETQALKLPTLLEGENLPIWLEFSEAEQVDIVVTKKKLMEKIMPIGLVSLDQFHAWMLRPGESLALYSYELKKPLGQAMPELTDDTVRRQLILHQFLSGIPEGISKQIRASA